MHQTPEKILSLAPDAATASRGRQLGSAYKWRGLGGNPEYIWGECRGRGLTYYRVQADLKASAYHCACPSKKRPCKHILGLLLILANDSEAFRVHEEIPDWVSRWIERREKAEEPLSPEEQARREEQRALAKSRKRDQRLERMAEGFRDLENWLLDMLRQGLAASEQQGDSFWQAFSTRMTDMQLRGISRRIRGLPEMIEKDLDWPGRILMGLADIYLVARGFEQLETLPLPLQQELLSIAGITNRKDDLLQQAGLVDEWAVVGQIEREEENLKMRKVWLYGRRSRQKALILDYVHQSMEFDDQWITGTIVPAELVFYPSAYPLRALSRRRKASKEELSRLKGYATLKEMKYAYAAALSKNPWLLDFPCVLNQLTPVVRKDQIVLLDKEQHYIPVPGNASLGWQLLALSGGHPIDVFGEWTGTQLLPLSTLCENRFVSL